MKRSFISLIAFAFVGLGVFVFKAGFLDRPPLEEATVDGSLYFFLAATTAKDIGGNIMRLLDGTKDAVSQVGSPEQLAKPAETYGAPQGAKMLSAGLYMDDPMEADHPRWGLGWAIQANSDEEAKSLLTKVQGTSFLEETMRLVKIPDGMKILRGRIPWRSVITPSVAPYLHWGRYYEIYKNGGYASYNGRPGDGDGSLALEVYVTGKNNSMEYIDYIILMGDTSAIFDSFDPLDDSSESVPIVPKKAEVEINPVPINNIVAEE